MSLVSLLVASAAFGSSMFSATAAAPLSPEEAADLITEAIRRRPKKVSTTIGNLGWEEVRFPKPVFAGDTIRAESVVVARRESKSRPNQGIVTFEHRGFNQRDEEVVYCRRVALMLRRPE